MTPLPSRGTGSLSRPLPLFLSHACVMTGREECQHVVDLKLALFLSLLDLEKT